MWIWKNIGLSHFFYQGWQLNDQTSEGKIHSRRTFIIFMALHTFTKYQFSFTTFIKNTLNIVRRPIHTTPYSAFTIFLLFSYINRTPIVPKTIFCLLTFIQDTYSISSDSGALPWVLNCRDKISNLNQISNVIKSVSSYRRNKKYYVSINNISIEVWIESGYIMLTMT